MIRYLVVAEETDSVVAEGSDLRSVVTEAFELGYSEGYVTNQDGGTGDLAELVERYCPHVHVWGPVEVSRFDGVPHRKCEGCEFISLDLEEEN